MTDIKKPETVPSPPRPDISAATPDVIAVQPAEPELAPASTPTLAESSTPLASAAFNSAPASASPDPAPQAAKPPDQPSVYTSLGQPGAKFGARAEDAPWTQTWRLIAARVKAISDKAGRRMMQRTLKIGVSARIFHPEDGAKGLRGRTLQYLEESIAQWVMSRDVLVFMIPTVNTNGLVHPSSIRLRDYAKHLDGLVLQGGADVSPQSYAEAATRPEWGGDRVRDMYELELLHEFIEAGKPVLGICRGCQLINVALGGTLYQDIATDVPSSIAHVNDKYDQLHHAIHFPAGSSLATLFSDSDKNKEWVVNSIHHQAVKDLGRDLTVEAVSGVDNITEAIRYRKAPFVMGLQWHPEFHRAGGPQLLDCTPILDGFLRAARETRF
ncbi:type 1 glutamine amidotransferase [Glaciimonas immobilis]|uniref:Gamma-glutamyl-gamma-aminobutyrate hydrolase PuuD n=1 Tax=Glaciimonas immobilis TaxID=728004 RepID=A0A840RXX7_9BURK|nr:type 1 glutamine amidotransferase [Glaciimonas immobilis]KAF3995958.1 C26 family cysteine hydrolase domain-containing family [Glaciimonas immobilis]MBB5202423.1 gamma-glutamyl-gamma-aminobutyrate hydrolase PuuD [Glaciimonas immobilis]